MANEVTTDPPRVGPIISLPPGFEIHGVTNKLLEKDTASGTPSLNSLEDLKGKDFIGYGFNTIFRPNSSKSKIVEELPTPPQGPNDNVLELNLTTETLSFTKSLGSVPNRGLADQEDINLSGVVYFQTVQDVTNPATGKNDGDQTEIHFEPGLWMRVPASKNNPVQVETLNRMASIPHGTTINAQGVAPTSSTEGPPQIPRVDITPFQIGTDPPVLITDTFPSLIADRTDTFRLPQDLGKFISAGTITQAILDDPNTVLRDANIGKTINKTTTIQISTSPQSPQLGGGTANIDFLMGGGAPNAHAVKMEATFWISEVSHQITIPVHTLKSGPLVIKAPSPVTGAPDGFRAPSFRVDPPIEITAPTKITVTSTQIQYTQNVLLDFATLSWPHVSVATLIPKDPIEVPQSAFS